MGNEEKSVEISKENSVNKSQMLAEEIHFTLEGYGKDKKEAFGMAFGELKKRVYKDINGLIIHMEPKDVLVVEEYEKTKTEKFVGYFKPRQIQDYYVKIIVIAMVKYIPL